MRCEKFKCMYHDGVECVPVNGKCIGDTCENWGECINCQQQYTNDCEGLKEQ